MAKRKAAKRRPSVTRAKKGAATRRPARRSGRAAKKAKAPARKASKAPKKRARPKTARKAAVAPRKAAPRRAQSDAIAPNKRPRLDRARRTLDDIVPTPPSSLNMDRRGSAARTGRAEMADNLRKHGSITPGITGGDVDADFENAYFSGDEAPGGDNPTPDQDVVDDIGRALGVEYNDNEELKSSDKVSKRDKHRWELDPASSEDYKDRD
jgi:hypothetical protein